MNIAETPDVARNLAEIRQRIIAANADYRALVPAACPVTLVAVCKRQPDTRIDAALAAGQRVFGENRVQEAASRWGARRNLYHDLRLHLIGSLQTNKVADAVALFDVIEVVDRPKLAKVLATEMERQNRRIACYIQVNTGDEPQKSGIRPDDADAFIGLCRDQLCLDIAGLMCIPPIDEEVAMHFALLQTIARRNGIANLSMGMSDDFAIAIGFGATSVRVGSAIFGPRDA